MGCNFSDSCSECIVGEDIGCGAWDEADHPPKNRNYDDDYYGDDYYEYLEYLEDSNRYDCNDDDRSNKEEADMNANGELYCVRCGTKVQENWRYCLRCGTPVPEKYCVKCGRAVDSDWEYCPKCDSSIPNAMYEALSTTLPAKVVTSPSSVNEDDIPL